MVFKVLGVWLLIDGLGSILVHCAGKKNRLRIIETTVRAVRIIVGATLVAVG